MGVVVSVSKAQPVTVMVWVAESVVTESTTPWGFVEVEGAGKGWGEDEAEALEMMVPAAI